MGGSQQLQDALNATQVAGGAAMTATGNPAMGVPMMVGGMQSATTPPAGPGQATPSPLASLNPAMLSQLMGGQQQKPQMPQQPPTRPPMNMQNAGQQVATPQAQPAPKPPQPPQMASPQNPMIAKLMQMLGGSA